MLVTIGILLVVAAAGVAYAVPRLSVYVVGPGVLIATAIFGVVNKRLFFFFQSDGSAAGLFLPILMWGAALFGVAIGFGLITTGLERLRADRPGNPDAR